MSYEEFVVGLAAPKSTESFENKLLTAGLGIAGEGGEVAEVAKKVVFHGMPFDREKLIKELGDVLWYVAFAAAALDVTIDYLIQRNMEKLRERYPGGEFSYQRFMEKEDGKNS